MGIPVEITPAWLKGEGGTVRIVREMLRAIEEGEPAPATTEGEGVRLMGILDADYKSARLGHEVRLDCMERSFAGSILAAREPHDWGVRH